MAYKCTFMDNLTYTAQDVNDIFARISHGGVSFTDTGYTLGDLNTVQSQVAGAGVVRDENSCRVVNEDGIYKISKGACFMEDGSAIIFDADGQEIQVIPEAINYVYLYRNTVANSIDIVVSEYQGDEGCIPLAKIDGSGFIQDMRRFARAKLDVPSWGAIKNFTVNFSECTPTKSETVTVDIGSADFSYFIFWDGERVFQDSYQARTANNVNLVELINGEDVTISIGKYQGQHDEYMHLFKDGQNLQIYLNKPFPRADYTINFGII